MDVIFIRHAIATERRSWYTAEQDAMRPVTGKGKRKFKAAAKGLALLLTGTHVQDIWTSPYVRAGQTARILYASGRFPKPHVQSFLAGNGDDEEEEWLDAIRGLPDDACCVWVGHEPYLSRWCKQLTGSNIRFRKGSAVAIHLTGEDKIKGKVLWSLRPRALRALGELKGKNKNMKKSRHKPFSPDSLQAVSAALLRDGLAGAVECMDLVLQNPDDPENVHGLRLHFRRIQTLVDFLRPVLKSKDWQSLHQAIRRMLRDTAPVREADMLVNAWNAYLEENGKKAGRGNAAKIGKILSRNRTQKMDRLIRILDKGKWAAPIKTLGVDAHSVKWIKKPGTAESFSSKRMTLMVHDLQRKAKPKKLDSPAAYHALRIQVKQLRILARLFEADGNLLPLDAEALAHTQDVLGDYNDARVNTKLARKMLKNKPGGKRFTSWLRTKRNNTRKLCAHALDLKAATNNDPELPITADATIPETFEIKSDKWYNSDLIRVRFGIVGVGNMGGQHARTLSSGIVEGAVLAAVADTAADRIEQIRPELPESVQYFNTAEAMMDSGEIDAVLIAVPHYDHPYLATEAMRRGLHVLVEKPAGVYARQVHEMNEMALRHPEVKFGIMFNNRTNPVFIRMHDMVANGELGDIKRTNWIITDWYRSQSYFDSGSWRATWKGEGGGVLLNQSPHNLDLWQWIVGMMPLRVRAFCHEGKWHNIEVEDDVTAYVEYPNGATGTFVTSTADTPGTNRFEVTGDKGKLVAENGQLIFHRLSVPEREFNRTYKGGFGHPPVERIEIDVTGEFPNHTGILRDFTSSILEDKPLWAPGVEGIKSLEISNAMHMSSWLGKTVDVPVDEDLYYELLQQKVSSSAGKDGDSNLTLNLHGSY